MLPGRLPGRRGGGGGGCIHQVHYITTGQSSAVTRASAAAEFNEWEPTQRGSILPPQRGSRGRNLLCDPCNENRSFPRLLNNKLEIIGFVFILRRRKKAESNELKIECITF